MTTLSPSLTQVTIAIVTKNRNSSLKRLISSILSYKNSNSINQILIIQDSVPSLLHHEIRILKKYNSNIKVVNLKNRNKVFARNYALKHCQTKFLMFLDDDVIINKQWLTTLDKLISFHLRGKSKYDFYQGSSIEYFGQTNNNFLLFIDELIREFDLYKNNSIKLSSLAFDTKNVLIDRQTIVRKQQYFDESFSSFSYGEDTDFGYRLQKNSLIGTFVKKLNVIHHRQNKIRSIISSRWKMGEAYGYFCKKHNFYFSLKQELIDLIRLTNFIYQKKINKPYLFSIIISYCFKLSFYCGFINQSYLTKNQFYRPSR